MDLYLRSTYLLQPVTDTPAPAHACTLYCCKQLSAAHNSAFGFTELALPEAATRDGDEMLAEISHVHVRRSVLGDYSIDDLTATLEMLQRDEAALKRSLHAVHTDAEVCVRLCTLCG